MSRLSINLRSLINRHGDTLTYTEVSEGAYDPTTGGVSNTDTTYTVIGYFHEYMTMDIDGQNVLLGDRKILISTEDTSGNTIPKPKAGDKFSGTGDEVTVVDTSEIRSKGAICYVCQVRE